MIDDPKLKADLIRDEGKRLFLYQDSVGKWTGGVGHNFTDRGISEAVCDLMLSEDMGEAIDIAASYSYYSALTDERKRVLVNMAFNLGKPRLSQFLKMHAALRQGDYKRAADEMIDSKWAGQVGDRATRLRDRMLAG
tara:strand:+ start:385 stop:795 length:411 start_codon:yes stop_codon:yes gene_type:complete